MSLYSFSKDVAKVAKEAGNINLYSQILEIQEKALELQNENAELKKQIEELKDNSDIAKQLITQDNVYYLENVEGNDGPFCTGCWDNSSKLIRLHVNERDNARSLTNCTKCEKSVWSDLY
ncbi:hypothetical protein [Aquisalibacillus elongatus]|uniref:Uncharacterized protein n=1 Tax=Aquisalibacillus elongatus TaxID=485577 RepID=A0A3N5BS31_9BACI|nr:hypothetical protein [Aquisalibacillus elongatus]RPF50302.1 hypothetical protein EDC24_2737 [Aquisalibacillus elongatus]